METKLTAKDLMIGDWVLCVDSTHKSKTYAQIDAIEEGQTCILVRKDNRNWFLDIGFIEPIPLTAEILEKNGWYIPTNSCWWHNNEIDFYLVGYTNGDFGIYTDGDSEFSDLCRINHVHELQNLYRICRFNKEIVL